MSLEISLTRLFSVLHFYHYVFLVLALALLGLGLGGLLAAALPDRHRRAADYAAGAATLAAVATVAATVLAARLLPAGNAILHGAVALAPFLFAGVALPLVLGARPAAGGRVYGGDLVGAAVGALLGFALLFFGAATAAFGAAVLFALAGWVVAPRPAGRRFGSAGLLVGLLAALFAVNATAQAIDVDLARLAAGKPLALWLERGEGTLTRTSWDPFARVDVVQTRANPLERLVFIDGAAGSPLPHYPADPNEETKRRTELGSFPYHLIEARRVLVIGSGGGIGVLYALLAGADDITAVEVSPGIVAAVRADGAYAGFLYDRPDVRVVVDEGRSFLDRDPGRYDVIDLSLVVSLATAHSGYALTENYLFTEEAFASAVDHLTADGIIALRLYDDPTLTRAFITAATALRRQAPSDAAAVRHLGVVFNPREAAGSGPAFYPLLLISKRPLTEPAARALASRAANLGFEVMFAPFVAEEGPFGKVVRGEASLASIQSELTGGVFTPTTDARPFFFELSGRLPRQLIQAWIAVGAIVAATVVGLLAARRNTRRQPSAAGGHLVYFALLGVAFMLVELALLARLSRFVGHPTATVAAVLAGLLVSAGIGSMLSDRCRPDALGRLIAAAAAVTATLALLMPAATDQTPAALLGLPLAGRVGVAVAVVVPFGLTMGMLFPSGLRLTAGGAALPWAVNGVASVVGAVAATTIALRFGYPTVAHAGAALYLAVALAGPWLLGRTFLGRHRAERRQPAGAPAPARPVLAGAPADQPARQ